jgi:hypothetical protein
LGAKFGGNCFQLVRAARNQAKRGPCGGKGPRGFGPDTPAGTRDKSGLTRQIGHFKNSQLFRNWFNGYLSPRPCSAVAEPLDLGAYTPQVIHIGFQLT